MNEPETWKGIPGFPGYEASDAGNIRGPRGVLHRRPFLARGGKLYVKTDITRQHKGLFVHRLVALAFLPEPAFGNDQVDHLNGDGTDNRPVNLEWVSMTENIRRMWQKREVA